MNGQTLKLCKASYFTNLRGSNHGKHVVSREYLAILDKAGGIVGYNAKRMSRKSAQTRIRAQAGSGKLANISADTNPTGGVTVNYKP